MSLVTVSVPGLALYLTGHRVWVTGSAASSGDVWTSYVGDTHPPSAGEHPGLAGTLFQTNWVPLPEQVASFVLSERGPMGDPQRQI